jgi:hypothetical protein
MRDRYLIDLGGHAPAQVAALGGRVVSLCDRAREALPAFCGSPAMTHRSLPDPAAGEDGLTGYAAFERAAAEIDTRIGFLLPVLHLPVPG